MESRLGDAALEVLQSQQPLSGYFSHLGTGAPNYSLPDAVDDIVMEIRAGTIEINERRLIEFLVSCIDNAKDIKRFGDPTDLTESEIASLLLFTAEFPNPTESPYKVLNACLRSRDRTRNRPFIRMIWLMLNGLKKCTAFERSGYNLVYRGIKGVFDISG